MTKFAAHLLIVLLLLNVMGYYGIFLGVKYRHAAQINQRLDDLSYEAYPTVTIKAPLTIPYYNDTQYERVSGEIEHQGEVYRLVKQKFEKDTLYIVCIKDLQGKRIQQALAEYVKNFSEHSADNSFSTAPTFIKDFLNTGSICSQTREAGWTIDLQFGLTEQRVKEIIVFSVSPPPEA